MSGTSSSLTATASYPHLVSITTSLPDILTRPSISPSNSSASSSASESDLPLRLHSPRSSSRRSRMERPRLGDRQRSNNTIIVPKSMAVAAHRDRPQYPPDDARAMSPRRNSQDIEALERGVRQSLKEQARSLQSSLAALAEKIDEVKSDHDKLENENRFLQDYIGGLTRTMSRESLGRSSSVSGMKKGRR